MKLGWKRLVVPVAVMAVVGLIGVTVNTAERTAPAVRPSIGGHPLALAGGQTAAAPKPRLAEEVFKNVQALKGVSVDDFLLTMGIMTSSLAFDCSSCHEAAGTDKVNWAADTPRKVIARKMVFMVQAINRDNFGGRQMVTCFTCHRNRDHPLTTPTMEMLYGTVSPDPDDFLPQTPGLPSADTIFDKYLAALGGAQRLSGLTSYVATGTSVGFGGFGGGGQVQIYAKAPNQRSTIVQFKGAPGRDDNARTFDGGAGWMRTPLSVLGEYELSGSELDGARLDAQLGFPGQIKQLLRNWRVSESSINDHDAYAVQGDGPRGTFATLYFDKQSGLLVRLLRYGPSPIGRIPTQVDYAEYREVGGIKFPFKWTFSWLDGRDAFQLSDIKTNVPIEAARFGKPSAARP